MVILRLGSVLIWRSVVCVDIEVGVCVDMEVGVCVDMEVGVCVDMEVCSLC